MHAMLARWIPPLEQSKFAAYVYAGNKDKKKKGDWLQTFQSCQR
jgi:hypothetical protein